MQVHNNNTPIGSYLGQTVLGGHVLHERRTLGGAVRHLNDRDQKQSDDEPSARCSRWWRRHNGGTVQQECVLFVVITVGGGDGLEKQTTTRRRRGKERRGRRKSSRTRTQRWHTCTATAASRLNGRERIGGPRTPHRPRPAPGSRARTDTRPCPAAAATDDEAAPTRLGVLPQSRVRVRYIIWYNNNN